MPTIPVCVIPGSWGIYIACNKVVLRCIAPVVVAIRIARRICITVRVSRTVNFYGRIINIFGRVSYRACRIVYVSTKRSRSTWYVASTAISRTSRKIYGICVFIVRITGIRRNIKCNVECLSLSVLKSDIIPLNCLPVNRSSVIRRLWYKRVRQSINYIYRFRIITAVSLVVCDRDRVGESCFSNINRVRAGFAYFKMRAAARNRNVVYRRRIIKRISAGICVCSSVF